MSGSKPNDYHELLARHHAMQLRKQILTPGQKPAATTPGGPYEGPNAFDARADQQMIIDNLHLVGPLGNVIEGLYNAMFGRSPFLRPLFPASMEFQRVRLTHSLRYLIDNLDRHWEVREAFGQLGRDHRKLGVWPVHYDTFEAALRDSLRRQARPGWRPEVEDAWMRMLAFAVDAMLSGAQAAVTEPPYWHCTVTGHELRRPGIAVLRLRTSAPYEYAAGQYGALESPLAEHTWRQYSMAHAPQPDEELEFHIRLTGPSGVSEALVTGTKVGDTLRLGPPHGTMILDEELTRDVLLVAGGTGLAPLKAILEELATRRLNGRRVHLFVGARDRSWLYDWDALADLDRRCRWLTVVPVLSDEPQFAGATGTVADAVARYGDWSQHVAYVSGPPKMVDSTVTRLLEMGTPPEQVRYDPVPGVRNS